MMPGVTLICCVVNMGDACKAMKYAGKCGIKGGTVSLGRGSIHSSLLDFLQINEVRKEIITMVVDNESAADAIKCLSEEMQFHKPHHGIAFSYSVSEYYGRKNAFNEKSETEEVKNNVYKAIFVIVDKGKAEDVIDAANKAGAGGGTIINARGGSIQEVRRLFSLEIEPEKEEVFIIAKSELKDSIVESVRTHLNIDEPGNGVIFVLDLDSVCGLRET